jgi:hypothetical protein
MEPLKHSLLALVCACASLGAGAASPENANNNEPPRHEASELELKAVYLLKFGDFVQWPANAFATSDAPLIIAVAGADALAAVLEPLAQQKRVDGRGVQIRRLKRSEALSGAHIVFVAAGELERLAVAQEALHGAPVLTVTDGSRATQPTGIINFVIRDNRVRFEIDAEAAEAAHLRISSKVLALAVSVKGARQR